MPRSRDRLSRPGFQEGRARLRNSAEARFDGLLQPALKNYRKANGRIFPKEGMQLQPFFAAGVDQGALQQLQVVRVEMFKNLRMGGEGAITQVAVVDSEFDAEIVIGPNGFGFSGGPRK